MMKFSWTRGSTLQFRRFCRHCPHNLKGHIYECLSSSQRPGPKEYHERKQ